MVTATAVTAVQTVIVDDVTAPVSPVLANVTGECSASITAPVAEDNCGGTITGTTSDPLTYNAQGTYTITWTFNDGNGNSSTAVQTVIVDDVTAPVAPVLAGVTGECSASVTAPVAEDNCGGTITGTTSDPLTYNAQGTYTITWTFNDGNGNSSSSVQLVVVNDVTNPSIICPAGIEVNPDAGSNTASNVELGLPQVSDNCQVGNVSNDAPDTFNTGTTYVTWTVTDLAGNTSSCIQTVTVADAEPPVINCPQAINVNCASEVPAPFADYMAFINAGGSVGDSNGINPQSFSMISENTDGNSCSQTITRVYSISDNIGNAAQCSHMILVSDTVAPVFTFVPENMTRECSGVPAPGTPTAVDNCSSNVTIVYNGQVRTDGNCPDNYTLTRSWTATDDCGNSTVASQVITVKDTKAPHVEVPASNLTVECDGTGNTADLNAWLSSNGGAIVTDNCGEISWSNNFASLSDNCGLTGSSTVVFTATDECGNVKTTSATFTIVDSNAPVFTTVPSDLTVECDGNGNTAALENWLNNAAASDLCGMVTITNNFQSMSDLCGLTGSALVTWTATDECGNSATTSATFAIADATGPVFTFVPANMTRECSGVPAPGTPTAVDNCSSNVTIVYNGQVRTDGNCPNNYTLTRSWTATDDCGNSTVASQVITVKDTKAPHVEVPASNLTVECDGSGNTADLNAWLSSNGGAIATDNCGQVSWSNNFTSLSDNCGLTGSATVVFTATDECGNVKTTSATFTIVDSNAPVFTTVPSDLTVECDGNGNTAALENWLNNPAASDLCGMVTITNNFQSLSDLCGLTGSALVTWTATDECGNSATTSATFAIADATGPVFTFVPANMTRECSGVPAPGTPTAVDNCSSNVTIVYNGQVRTDGNCPNNYTLTRSWTATDDCGNSTVASQVITVKDTKAPHVAVPAANLTVECDGSGNTADLNTWLSSNGGAIATDNCGQVSWSNNFASLSDNCGLTGSATVIFTASDECGNRKTTSATFTIVDSNAPEFTTTPSDLTVECDGNGNTAALENWLNNVAASDLCGMVSISNNFQSLSDLCGLTGSALVTWTATDECGNSATTSATFAIADATGPVFTFVPANMTRECSGVPAPGTPTAVDNCSSNVTIVYNGQVRTDGNCPNNYTLTRSWTATDDCGNSTVASQVITVKDTKAPHVAVPASNLTVECDGTGNTADLNTWLSSNGGAIATDNCGQVSWSNNFASLSDNCGLTGSATVIFTASDECGNRKTTSATFTIVDTNAPEFTTTPSDLTVECDGNGNTAALENWLNNVAAADQCGEVTISNNFQSLSDLCGSTGSAMVTWTATDACGNTATASATFTIEDTNAPEFTTTPADLTVECDGNGNTAALENWLNNVAAADQCGEVTISNNFQSLSDLCGSTGSAMVTWTATDACGNTATASATFTIEDTNAPEFTTTPADLTVECDGNGNTAALENWLNNVAAADQCGEVTISNNFQSLSDLCGSTGSAMVTWTATDACGNTATASATFTIEDTNAPEFTTTPADLTVECDGNGNTAALENWLNNVAAADQCGEVTISNNFESLSDLCGSTGSAMVTWTATDACGNTATASATFTIEDTNAPEFTTTPADLTVECDGNGNTAALENWLNNVAAADQCGEVTISNNFQSLSDLCGSTGSAMVTWTATDACGNTATASATFTIEDTNAPEFTTTPSDLTVECDGNGNTAALENWLNNVAAADQCGEVTISNNFQSLSDLCGSTGSAMVTWTATDACGNTATASATFTIEDTNAPEFTTTPADLTVECSHRCLRQHRHSKCYLHH
ncbi:MAG: HYR domain-containing protein [Bacteroidales bacterium]|nr:HYR domain-containing protein [Bacteroidales bacterium]